jgi:hypothetical protein
MIEVFVYDKLEVESKVREVCTTNNARRQAVTHYA